MAVFKVKALKNWGEIVEGMEVEIIIKNAERQPTQNEIQKAFEEKYNINAPNGVYSSKSSFLISKA